ncbi:hypothetical protein [Halomarina oriensis]|uniref:Uncharacterized protein n=1 Tax=Halomarina oriensis TaxID=671145 RepID=A0A6B0GDM8_9EURY|nr:hypothetical protein [Halomarina oriensis]MWG33026.1 hypothetical protein [Halomarina oriensis]
MSRSAAVETARSTAERVAPHLPPERVVVTRAFDCALGAAAWFVPALLLVVGTPLPIVGLFGGLWLALVRPEHYVRLLRALGLDSPFARRALGVAGVTLWTLGPVAGPPTGTPVWLWFSVGLLGVAPYGGVGDRPDAITVVLGRVFGPVLALLALTPVLAAGGLVAGVQVAFAVTAALGVLALVLGVPLDETPTVSPSMSAFVEWAERLPPAERRLLLADTWARTGLAVVGPLFVAFSIQRLGDGFAEGAEVIALSLVVATVAAGGTHRVLSRIRELGSWTTPLLSVGGLLVATTAPLAVVLVPASPPAFAGTFAAVGVAQGGWTVLEDEVTDTLGEHRDTYRAARALLLIPPAVVGGLLFAVAPRTAFVLSSVLAGVGTVSYLRRVAR